MVRKHGIASPQQGEAMSWSRDMMFKFIAQALSIDANGRKA